MAMDGQKRRAEPTPPRMLKHMINCQSSANLLALEDRKENGTGLKKKNTAHRGSINNCEPQTKLY